MTQVAIAHVGADFWVARGSGSAVLDGITDIKGLGATACKIWFSDQYAVNDYPLEPAWSATPTSLITQAQLSEFSGVLGDNDLDVIMINVWPYAGFSTADNWKGADTSFNTKLAAEYTETYDLAAHLLTTYNDTGKTFILQNWESDWSLLADTDPATHIPARRADYMLVWLRNRCRAIEAARRATSYTNVRVLSAVEVNRVVDCFDRPDRQRMCNYVLPRLQADLVSYSAYDVLTQYGASQAEQLAYITTNLPRALDTIRRAAPNSGVYIGEFGWPEAELGGGYSSNDLMDHVMGILDDDGEIDWACYWGCYDNEDPRGFYCIDSDGSTLSGAGEWINDALGGSF